MEQRAPQTEAAELRLEPSVAAVAVAIACGIFGADLLLPEGILVPVLYVGLVLVSCSTRWPPLAIWLALAASLLTAVGYLLSPEQDVGYVALANRFLTLAAVWVAAVLCHRRTVMANDLRRSRDALQSRAEQTAATAERTRAALTRERLSHSRTEENLHETEKRYRGVFNQTFQLVAILTPDGAVEEANETLLTAVGLPSHVVQGKPIWTLRFWGDGDAAPERMQAAVMQAARGDFFRGEFEVTRPTADPLVVDVSIKPVRGFTGDVAWLILEARDITLRKREHELLLQAQKSEVVAQLTSGVAHDFNNLLTVISGNLELVGRRLKNTEDEAVNQRIEKALNAAFRGRALTDHLLAFARKQDLSPQVIDLNEAIANVDDLLLHASDDNIEVATELSDDLWACRIDPGQIQAAVLNLMLNARDAMPDGGRVVIRTANVRLAPSDLRDLPDLDPGDYVALSVADEGSGIPQEILEKVVDPFFTTKPTGKGSGLGLSMVYGLVKQSGGDLRIESLPNAGTTVTIFFPRAEEEPSVPPQAAGRVKPSLAPCRILLVEDDPDVREIATSVLSDLECHVEQAENGDRAVEILRSEAPFDVLITDVRMPGHYDGPALARYARERNDHIEILYISAHPRDIGGDDHAIPAGANFIAKPFRYDELAGRIGAILQERG